MNALKVLCWGIAGSLTTLLMLFLLMTPRLSLKTVEVACNGDCADADTIQVAMALGRLDIVSLCLALLGVSIAVLAILGFFAVKEKASIEARDAASEIVREWLKSGEGSKVLAQEVGKLMEINEEQMTDEKANSIMQAFSSENGESGGAE